MRFQSVQTATFAALFLTLVGAAPPGTPDQAAAAAAAVAVADTTSSTTPQPTDVKAAAENARPADLQLTNSASAAGNTTTFNGMTVPPMKELTDKTFDDTIKQGYWFVKHYSPSCPHCRHMAQSWQTLYEYYYTSNPLPQAPGQQAPPDSLNSFSKYYNFEFAEINCLAFGDKCQKIGITAWPTLTVYKDGVAINQFMPIDRTPTTMSPFVEEILESIRPGSRPPPGSLNMPEPGDKVSPTPPMKEVAPPAPKNTTQGIDEKELHHGAVTLDGNVVHNEDKKLSLLPSPTPVKATPIKATTLPTSTANPDGLSLPLTGENFERIVTRSFEPWFVKFYAPWCTHCKALAPNWDQMARSMKGKLNVGQVNCDADPRLCKDLKVQGYPTMYFFKGADKIEYKGLRGLGDLNAFTEKAIYIQAGVQQVNAEEFKALEEKEEVIFVYFYDHATTTEDFQALDRLLLSLTNHAKLVKTDDKDLADRFKIHTWPRLMVARDGQPSYYSPLAPKDMRDPEKVLDWMRTVWLPIVPELTAANAHEIMANKYVVLGILSRTRDVSSSKHEIKNAALEWMEREQHAFQLERQELRDSKQLRTEEAKDRNDERGVVSAMQTRIELKESDRLQIGFAWIDGVFWERWIRTTYGINVADGEKVIINDENNKRYWDTTISGAPITPSRTSIMETLTKVTHDPPRIQPKYTTNKVMQLVHQVNINSRRHPWLTVAGVVIALILFSQLLRQRIGRRQGYFNLDNAKEAILGQQSRHLDSKDD